MPAGRTRTGVAAMLAGILTFLGQAGELAFGSPGALFLAIGSIGLAAFVVAVWGFRTLVRGRVGRIGWWLMAAGSILVGLFAVQAAITVVVTGDVPDNFVLFALGFALMFLGQVVIAPGLRLTLGRLWILLWVGAAGLVVAITLDVDPIHDIGLFVFEGAWVALGAGLIRGGRLPERSAVTPA